MCLLNETAVLEALPPDAIAMSFMFFTEEAIAQAELIIPRLAVPLKS